MADPDLNEIKEEARAAWKRYIDVLIPFRNSLLWLPIPTVVLAWAALGWLVGGWRLSLLAGGFFAIQTYSEARAAAEFEVPAARFTATLTEAIDAHLRAAEAAGDLFEGYTQADRWAFYDFATETRSRLPGIQTLEWIPRVRENERRAYEGRARVDGLAEFSFREDTAGRGLVSASTRTEYYPVYYFEPFEGHEAALGVDLAINAAEWQAIARARDDGAMVAIVELQIRIQVGMQEFAPGQPAQINQLEPMAGTPNLARSIAIAYMATSRPNDFDRSLNAALSLLDDDERRRLAADPAARPPVPPPTISYCT